MSAASNGGPAFPVSGEYGQKIENAPGMTLRDYFAAKALPEVMNKRRDARDAEYSIGTNGFDICYARPIAREAYIFADAMIAERAQTGGAQ